MRFRTRGQANRTGLRQTVSGDCGLVALERVLSPHVDCGLRALLRRQLGYGGTAASVYDLCVAARACGFDAEAFEVETSELSFLPLPAILHLRRGHYMVLERITARGFQLYDPAVGNLFATSRQLDRWMSGVVLAVEPPPAGHEKPSNAKWTVASSSHSVQLLLLTAARGILLSVLILTVVGLMSGRFADRSHIHLSIGAIVALMLLAVEVESRRASARIKDRIGRDLARKFTKALAAAHPEYLTSRSGSAIALALTDVDPLFNISTVEPRARYRAVESVVIFSVLGLLSPISAASAGIAVSLAATVQFLCQRLISRRSKGIGSPYTLSRSLSSILSQTHSLLAIGALLPSLMRWRTQRNSLPAMRLENIGSTLFFETSLTLLIACHLIVRFSFDIQLPGDQLASSILLSSLGICSVGMAATGYRRTASWKHAHWRLDELSREYRSRDDEFVPTDSSEIRLGAAQLLCEGLTIRPATESATSPPPCFSLSVSDGQGIVIVGESGSGKTHLAELLAGIREPAEGRVLIEGRDVWKVAESTRRSLVAAVFEGSIGDGETLRSYLDPLGISSDARIAEVVEATKLTRLIDRFPLGPSTPINTHPTQLSTSERISLSIARALLFAPKVIIMDGLLDVLDEERAKQIVSNSQRIVPTVILLTCRHELSPRTFRRFSLKGGALIAQARSQ